MLVLGSSGMLGSAVVPELATQGFAVTACARRPLGIPADVTFLPCGDLRETESIEKALDGAMPNAVVNCAGLVKQRASAQDAIASIEMNALLPHRLASMCAARGVRLVQIGTDCVFSGDPDGRRGALGYREGDPNDPVDVYGRSKLLGEVAGPGCVTLRMSLIGRETNGSRQGLLEWFLGAQGPVVGFSHAVFTGVTTRVAARLIATVLRDHAELSGIWHASAAPISKLDLLRCLRDRMRPRLKIEISAKPVIDRRLDGSAFTARTGWIAPGWGDMLDEIIR